MCDSSLILAHAVCGESALRAAVANRLLGLPGLFLHYSPKFNDDPHVISVDNSHHMCICDQSLSLQNFPLCIVLLTRRLASTDMGCFFSANDGGALEKERQEGRCAHLDVMSHAHIGNMSFPKSKQY